MSNSAGALQIAAPFIAISIATGVLLAAFKPQAEGNAAAAAALKEKCEKRDPVDGMTTYYPECAKR